MAFPPQQWGVFFRAFNIYSHRADVCSAVDLKAQGVKIL